MPGMPGRRQQTPRTSRRTGTPAWEAVYSARITFGSVSEFIFASMPAGRPFSALSISRLIFSRIPWCRVNGE